MLTEGIYLWNTLVYFISLPYYEVVSCHPMKYNNALMYPVEEEVFIQP